MPQMQVLPPNPPPAPTMGQTIGSALGQAMSTMPQAYMAMLQHKLREREVTSDEAYKQAYKDYFGALEDRYQSEQGGLQEQSDFDRARVVLDLYAQTGADTVNMPADDAELLKRNFKWFKPGMDITRLSQGQGVKQLEHMRRMIDEMVSSGEMSPERGRAAREGLVGLAGIKGVPEPEPTVGEETNELIGVINSLNIPDNMKRTMIMATVGARPTSEPKPSPAREPTEFDITKWAWDRAAQDAESQFLQGEEREIYMLQKFMFYISQFSNNSSQAPNLGPAPNAFGTEPRFTGPLLPGGGRLLREEIP